MTLKLEVGQVVYIPGAVDIRNENTNHAESSAMSKEEKMIINGLIKRVGKGPATKYVI